MREGVGGHPLFSREPPEALPAAGIFWGLGDHADGVAGSAGCILPTSLTPPEAPEQRRLHQQLPVGSWEAVVLSHPGLCHFSETSAPPPPRPLGRLLHWPGPKCRPGSDAPHTRCAGDPRLHSSCLWAVSRPQGDGSGPPTRAAARPPHQLLPRPGQINIYLEKAKVRTKNLSRNSAHSRLVGWPDWGGGGGPCRCLCPVHRERGSGGPRGWREGENYLRAVTASWVPPPLALVSPCKNRAGQGGPGTPHRLTCLCPPQPPAAPGPGRAGGGGFRKYRFILFKHPWHRQGPQSPERGGERPQVTQRGGPGRAGPGR